MPRLGNPVRIFVLLSALLTVGCNGPLGGNDGKINSAAGAIEKRQFSDARKILDEVTKNDPANNKAIYYLAVVDTSEKKYHDALEKLNRAIQQDPGFAAAYSQRALVNHRLVNKQSAMDDINSAIRLDPRDGKAFHRRAILRISERQYDEALKDLDESQRLQPDQPAYFLEFNRGVCYAGKRDYQRAVEFFNAAAKSAQQGQDEFYLRRALAQARLNNIAAATKDISTYMAAHKDSLDGLALHAALASARGNQQDARKEFQQLIKKQPEATIAEFIDLGPNRPSFSDFSSVGLQTAPSLVVSCLTLIQRERPLEPEEQLALAKGMIKQGNQADAKVMLENSLASDPASVSTRIELIKIYLRSGMRDKARLVQSEGLPLAESASERARLQSAL